jgi:hypothetical protein
MVLEHLELTERVPLEQSCETEQYVHNARSQVVNTAWGASRLSAFAITNLGLG